MSEPTAPASLFAAVRADDAATVRALLEQDAALADAVEGRLTPLGCAAACGADAALRALLDAGVPPDPPEGADLVPPLVAAARHGCHAAAETLLIYGANVDARDLATQDTPLLAAAAAGDAKMVRHFVSWGADLEATDPQGLTAYQIAHRAGNDLVMKRLVDGGADDTPAPEPERIAIRYAIALDDVLAFFRFYADTSEFIRARRRRQVTLYPALFLVAGAVLAWRTGNTLHLVFQALLAAAFACWVLFGSRRLYLRNVARLYATGRNADLFCEHEMELLPDGYLSRTDRSESRAMFDSIERIVTTDSHVFFMVGAANACIIPRDKVIEGDLDDFVAKLTERWEAQREEPAGRGA